MTLFKTLVLAAALASGLTSAAALADPSHDRGARPPMSLPPQRDADRAFEATREGRSMPLPQLERRVMPMMGGADYLGPEMNGDTYRFKFMQNGEELVLEPFQRLIREKQLMAYEHNGFYASMDTFKDKQQLDDLYARGDAPWEVWRNSSHREEVVVPVIGTSGDDAT